MSEKKRVRVYRPKVNTDHFANYMFEVGGPVGQASMPMMQQPQDISKDIADILQMYAQSKGLDEQQLQQMFAAIMQMEPDQQQQAIAQMQQELGSELAANPMVAKRGGYIKETKKLLSKKIGGVSTNMTSKDLVGQRLELVKKNIGGKYANALLQEATEEQLAKDNEMLGQASQNLAMASMPPMPAMDYGGYVNDMYNMGMGIASGKQNQFIQDVIDTKMQFRNDLSALGSNLAQMRFRPSKKGTKIRKSGDIFNKQQVPENPAQVSTDVPDVSTKYDGLAADELYNVFGLKNGGGIPSYQKAGTIDTGNGFYDPVTRTIDSGDGSPRVVDEDEHNWIMSQVTFGKPSSTANETANDQTVTTNQTGNTGQGTGQGISGWHGGFYWQNGVPVTSVWDQNAMNQMQGQQGMQGMQGMDFASLFSSPDRSMRIKGNLLDMARNPYIAKQFGKALTDFQPDNVYLSKAKGRVNPFGAKVVLKWDYDENGRPVQEGDDKSSRTIGSGNLMGRMFKNNDLYQQVLANRADKAYEKSYGHAPGEGNAEDIKVNFPEPPLSPEQKAYMQESLNPEYLVPYNTSGPRNEEFAYGGMPKARAGKMVIKQQFMPVTSDAFQAYTPIANALASGLNMRGLDEQEQMAHLADFYTPSIPMGPGGMGTKTVGPNMGSESRFNPMFGATGNYADSLYQNEPVYGIAAGMGYQPYRKYGGMYQEGGVADYQEGGTYEELSDDELDQIFLKGGKVQYY